MLAVLLVTCGGEPTRSDATVSQPQPSSSTTVTKFDSPPPVAPCEVRVFITDSSAAENALSIQKEIDGAPCTVELLDIRVGFGQSVLGDAGLIQVLKHPRLSALRHLSVIHAGITSEGLAAIFAAPFASKLLSLDLHDNPLGAAGAQLFATEERLRALQNLNLRKTYLHAEGARVLSTARGLSTVKTLDLGCDYLRPEGAAALARNTAFPALKWLGLTYNYLDRAGALEIARARSLAQTQAVDLRGNEIDVTGLEVLASSNVLPVHARIWVEGNISADARDILRTRPRLQFGDPPTPTNKTLESDYEIFPTPKGDWRFTATTTPPLGLPSEVELRELWIWEFGLVCAFPTFMTPAVTPGNGKSRTFEWMNRARVFISGSWNNNNATLKSMVDWRLKPEPGRSLRPSQSRRRPPSSTPPRRQRCISQDSRSTPTPTMRSHSNTRAPWTPISRLLQTVSFDRCTWKSQRSREPRYFTSTDRAGFFWRSC